MSTYTFISATSTHFRFCMNYFLMFIDYSPRPHVTEIMLAYLLNVKEWNVLTELDVRGGAPTPDYREV